MQEEGTKMKHLKNLWKDESAQGMTEYILLLVVIVAIVVIFKDKIKSALGSKLEELGGSILNFKGE